MTTTRAPLVAICALAALSAASSARALPVDQYLKLRRQAAVDRKLTYAQLEINPAAYVGRVIEMRGKVNGAVRRDASISFLLSLETGKAIMLGAPPADTQIVSQVNNQSLRVLAKVTDGSGTNLVPLEVLGIAYDSEVSLKEKEAESRQAAEAQRQKYTTIADRPAAELSSRGGGYYARPAPNPPPGGGQLSEWALRYLNAEAQSVYPHYKAFIRKCNKRLTEEELDGITVAILYHSVRHQVDPRLVVALIIAESDFNPRSTSHKGAMGLGQIMPDEARDHKIDPYNPVENVRACVNLLRMKLNLYAEPNVPPGMLTRKQIMLTLAAYNAGSGAVRKYRGVPPYRETQGYVKRVMGLYDQFCSGG
jgi:soluble lytic murein transglycosylase-like protein